MTSAAGPTNLAALDLGTNSFHLVVARLLENGFEIVTREKETVRLGHGGGDMKELSADAIDRGISSLRRMQRIAASHGSRRFVRWRPAPFARHRTPTSSSPVPGSEAKVDVEVISGLEEARLIHLGVLQAVPVFDQRMLLVDIGGGSTEVLVGERGETLAARSFKLGAVRLTDRFFPAAVRPRLAPSTNAARTSARCWRRSNERSRSSVSRSPSRRPARPRRWRE